METFDFPPGAGLHPARPAPRQRVAPPPVA